MKLIIDIPEVVKHKIYAYGLSLSPSDKEQLIRAIMNGTPLDNLRAEITEYKDDKIIHAERNEMIDIVLDIIDHYKKRGE